MKVGLHHRRIYPQAPAPHHLPLPPKEAQVAWARFWEVGRAVATVWDVKRSSRGVMQNLEAQGPFINHYSCHILDPDGGHLTLKMAGHPPFGAQIILNGHA